MLKHTVIFLYDGNEKELFNKGALEWLNQDRDVPRILIIFNESSVKERDRARQTLEAAGISTLELGSHEYSNIMIQDIIQSYYFPETAWWAFGNKKNSHIVSDASNIKWFAYNQ